MFEKSLSGLQIDFVFSLFGALDSNVDLIEKAFSVRISTGEDCVRIVGEHSDGVNMAAMTVQQLERITNVNGSPDVNTINYVISMVRDDKQDELSAIYNDCICLSGKGRPIKPKTVGQQKYVELI